MKGLFFSRAGALLACLVWMGCGDGRQPVGPDPDNGVDAVEDLLPDRVAGVQLTLLSAVAEDLVEEGGLLDFLDTLGKTRHDVSLALAFAPEESDLRFQMGALRIAGYDWAAGLEPFLASVQAASNGALRFERVDLGGKSVIRGWHAEEPGIAPIYYYPLGDVLVYPQSHSAAAVAEALGSLPAAAAPYVYAGSPPAEQDTVTGWRGYAAAVYLARPPAQICVRYPESILLHVFLVDPQLKSLIPSPWFEVIYTAENAARFDPDHRLRGSALFEVSYTGLTVSAAPMIRASARLLVEDESFLASVELPPLNSWVRPCLSGRWQDGPRILEITHTGSSITAEIAEGALVCGETGRAFSSTLSHSSPWDWSLAGDDLKVCNPARCESLPVTEVREFTGTLLENTMHIDFVWSRQIFDEDCKRDGTENASFSITRLTFDPPKPF